jgi:ethanolamine utilization protein EutN
MRLGKVLGKVWAVQKVKELQNCRFLIVQPIQTSGKRQGDPIVCADPQQISGPGDRVVYVTSTDATQAIQTGFAPVNACIVELVDSVD